MPACFNDPVFGQTLFASIGGGGENRINDACTSFIGGGDYNCIQPGGGPAIVCRSFIGGGVANCIFENTSAIVGGISNVINASCGAILGGQNNTINHNYAAVFGNGITSAAADTFHVSCLNAVNTPASFPLAPVGTVMWKNIGAILPTDKILVIA